jgi:polar amino acid transport system substrate-binding protein
MYDVVNEIIKRIGYKNKIEFIPWPRARFEAENNSDIVILPLARTKDREKKYTWLLHVLDDPYVIVALKDSKVDISTLKSAKKFKIGILSSSVAENLLKELGFTNLEFTSSDVQNVKKLKLGRIDAWVAPLSCINQYRLETGIGKESMKVGVELTKLKEYVGASKTLDKSVVKKWEKTFEMMKKDGTYDAIMKKYGMNPL